MYSLLAGLLTSAHLLLATTTASDSAGAAAVRRVMRAARIARPAASTGALAAGIADSIVIEKSERRLTLFAGGQPLRTYLVALGGNPQGDKERAGDRRTPEGVFTVEGRNPNSRYHLALRISYPDAAHLARARARGESPGGDIMIHGLPNGQGAVGAAHREFDWTNGCIAVTDEEIEEIYRAVPNGARIEIRP